VSKKLFIGSLAYSVTQAQLEELFAQAGKVESASVIIDRETGRSKGFGFVEMSSDAEAAEAITKFNGYNLDGRAMVVNEARPQAPRPAFGGGGDRGFGGGRSSGGGYGRDRDRRPRY